MKKKTINNAFWPTTDQLDKFHLGNYSKEDIKKNKKIELIDKLIEAEQPELDIEVDKNLLKYNLLEQKLNLQVKIHKLIEDHNQVVQYAALEFAKTDSYKKYRKHIKAKRVLDWTAEDNWLDETFNLYDAKRYY